MNTYFIKPIKKVGILFTINLIIALFLFQIAYLTGNRILIYLGSILILWEFVFASKVETICIIMFMLPSNEYVMFAGTSLITILVTIYFLKSTIFFKESINLTLVILSVILIIYTLPFQKLELTSTAIKVFLYLHFSISTFTEKDKSGKQFDNSNIIKKKYKESIIYLGLGILVASFFTIVINPGMINQRFSLVSSEQSTNMLGILTAFTIGNILMIIQNNNFKVKKGWIYAVIPLTIIGMLTQSRTFIFLIVIIIIWIMIFILIKSNSKSRRTLFGFLIVTLVLGFFLLSKNRLFIKILSNAIERIINPRNNDISGGRSKLYWIYINELIKNKEILFFGTGSLFSANTHLLAHNIIIEQLYYIGLLGNFIIVMMFNVALKIIFVRNNLIRKSLYGFLPIIIFSSAAMASHTFIGRPDTIRFIISVIAVRLFSQDNIDL